MICHKTTLSFKITLIIVIQEIITYVIVAKQRFFYLLVHFPLSDGLTLQGSCLHAVVQGEEGAFVFHFNIFQLFIPFKSAILSIFKFATQWPHC